MPKGLHKLIYIFRYLVYEEIGTGYGNVDLQTEENDVRSLKIFLGICNFYFG